MNEPLTYASAQRLILSNTAKARHGLRYWLILALLVAGVVEGVLTERRQILVGIGQTGLNNPVAWSTYLVNFVFWIGIGHAGTLISAILYLLRARFRTAVARAAETMTVFAVITAGLFPILHLGRPWVFYWILPYPNQRHLWPDFVSPLIFDVMAVSTYMMVSIMFWYTGLIPDLASARDQSTGLRRKVYGLLALGWRGGERNWRHYARAYLFFAAMATPLVISVHSVVSWDFALPIVPGWHSTIYPPYFVAGAIHSGFALVMMILIPLRKAHRIESIITVDVLEKMAKVLIVTGLIMSYAYVFEMLVAFYSQNPFEVQTFWFRLTGFAAPVFWPTLIFNGVAPMLFFWRRIRRATPWLFGISLLILTGMWLERFLIIITMRQDYIPYSWGGFVPSLTEWGIFLGSVCWFGMWFWIFIGFFPVVSLVELKEEIPAPVSEAAHGAR